MAFLPTPHDIFFIVKVAGENGSDDVDCFVAHNTWYFDQDDANKAAEELALKTPGNRYYVVLAMKGYLASAPVLETVEYAELS
jgi:hypothetical protein